MKSMTEEELLKAIKTRLEQIESAIRWGALMLFGGLLILAVTYLFKG